MGLQLPTPYLLAKQIDEEIRGVSDRIRQLIGSRFFSISADEATTKSMNMKCLGTTVHFVNAEIMEIQNASIGLKEVTERSTAAHIRELIQKVISDFGLDGSKVVRMVTDGASTMQSAFLYV
jgi:hypothetical protein